MWVWIFILYHFLVSPMQAQICSCPSQHRPQWCKTVGIDAGIFWSTCSSKIDDEKPTAYGTSPWPPTRRPAPEAFGARGLPCSAPCQTVRMRWACARGGSTAGHCLAVCGCGQRLGRDAAQFFFRDDLEHPHHLADIAHATDDVGGPFGFALRDAAHQVNDFALGHHLEGVGRDIPGSHHAGPQP